MHKPANSSEPCTAGVSGAPLQAHTGKQRRSAPSADREPFWAKENLEAKKYSL